MFLVDYFSSAHSGFPRELSSLCALFIQACSRRELVDSLVKVVVRAHEPGSSETKWESVWQFLALLYFRFPETQSDLLTFLLVGQSTSLVQFLCLELEACQSFVHSPSYGKSEGRAREGAAND